MNLGTIFKLFLNIYIGFVMQIIYTGKTNKKNISQNPSKVIIFALIICNGMTDDALYGPWNKVPLTPIGSSPRLRTLCLVTRQPLT